VLQEAHTKGRIAGCPAPERLKEAEARLKVIELGWHNDARAYAEFFAELHIPASTTQQRGAYNALLRRMTNCDNAVALLKSFWQVDVRPYVPRVSCPTLVVHARGDSVIPFEEGRTIASLLPDAGFLMLDSRNHLLLATEPEWDRFVRTVSEFLSSHEPATQPPAFSDLTPREREALELLAQGYGNGEIAAALGITEKTVRNHVSIILDKLSINRRSQLIVVARQQGYGQGRGPRVH
jgi:DNA-binding CsgD family transcriptional regulator